MENYCFDDPLYWYAHYASFSISLLYLLLAVPGRFAFTWISLDTRTEYTKTLDILFYFSQTSQFWLDFLTVPILYWEFQQPRDFPDNNEFPSTVHLIKLMGIARAKRLFDEKEINNWTVLNIIELIVGLAIVSHLFSIIFISAGWHQRIMAGQKSWLDVFVDNDTRCYELYITGFYFSAATWFTVGYGDISPKNSMEMAISV